MAGSIACGSAMANVLTGRLAITDAATGMSLGYVGLFDSGGLLHTTQEPGAALQVSFDAGTGPFSLRILNLPQASAFPFFGGVQGQNSSSDDFAAGSANYAIMVGVAETAADAPASLAINSFTPFFAPISTLREAESAIWTLSSTNVLAAQWINSDGTRPATYLALSDDIFLAGTSIFVLTGDPAQSATIFGPGPTVDLVFVPRAVPEPSVAMLLALGAAAIVHTRGRRLGSSRRSTDQRGARANRGVATPSVR